MKYLYVKSIRFIVFFGLFLPFFLNAQSYEANFGTSSNPSGYSDEVYFTLAGQPWLASARYHNGNDFRLGKDTRTVVPSRFMSTTTTGASVEMLWDMAYPKSISLSTSTSYGTPRVWWIYESTDQGTSWQLVETQNYTVNSEWTTINVVPKPSARYAFVITGISNPRVRLNQIKIEVEAPVEAAPVYASDNRIIEGRYGEALRYALRFQHYPTSFEVTGLESLGLTFDAVNQRVEGTPTVLGEHAFQVQASNAFGESAVETLWLRSAEGYQSVTNLSDLTLGFHLQTYVLPEHTDQGQLLTYTTSDPSVAILNNNILQFIGVGTFHLTASAAASANYHSFSQTVSVRINKGLQHLATDYHDLMARAGETMELPLTVTVQQQPLRFHVLDTAIATMDGNQLYFNQPGRTTLQIEAEGNALYNAFTQEVMVETVAVNTCYFENFSSKVLPEHWIGSNANFSNSALQFGSNNGHVIFPIPADAKVLKFDLERTSTTTARTFYVHVSSDQTTFQTIASFTPANTDLLQTITLDLSPYAGLQWIKMEKVANTTAYWRVDNLKIECEPQRLTTIWQNGNWSNGSPDVDKMVIIQDPYEITNGRLEAYALTIEPNGSLVVKTNNVLKVVSKITNQGDAHQFILEDGAFVLQNDEVTNTGEAMVYKYSRPMYRNDMTIWSSPVTGQYIRAFSPETLYYRIWDYDETTTNYRPLFETETSTDLLFEAAKGIGIRVRNTLPTHSVEPYHGVFKGVLNNGNYQSWSTRVQWGYNLVGNPYPSSIALDGPNGFFAQNPNVTQLFLWTPYYRTSDANFGNNYMTITRAGAVGPYPDNPRFIAPGQGFFVQVNTPSFIYFNNAMRAGQPTAFYRTTQAVDQYYLTFTQNNTLINRHLIRYGNETTNDFDAQWDALSVETGEHKIYGVLNDLKLSIQARGSFQQEDRVQIGYQTSSAGEFEIQLENAEGRFDGNYSIYLQDKWTQVVHPIADSPYAFYTAAGTFNDRFEIIYQLSTLGTNDTEQQEIEWYTDHSTLVVHSSSAPIERWKITTSDGRIVAQAEKLQQNKLRITLPKGIYIFSVNVNGQNIHQKFIIY